MPANIARSHDEFLRADSRFHFALHHVGNRFMRVGVKRGADSRRIVDLEERHLVTLDKRLDEHIAAIQRLALDGAYRHSLDVGISRLDHIGLPAISRNWPPEYHGLPGTGPILESAFEELQAGLYQVRFVRQ